MFETSNGHVSIEERSVSIASVQLTTFEWDAPIDAVLVRPESYWIDLCLTPRPHDARASFHDRWGPHRFEPLGDMFLVPPGEAMHARAGCGRQLSVVCELRADPIRHWLDRDLEWTDRRLEAGLDIVQAEIRSLMFKLAGETRNPGFASDVMIELVAGQIAIEVGRYCASIEDQPAAGGLAPWRMRLIDERLSEVRAPPTLSELATLCNLSIRQLTRGFRVSRGCSIGDHIETSRIDSAKRLLAGDDECIKSIAYSMGFATPSSFASAFRRATGCTPREYRDRLAAR